MGNYRFYGLFLGLMVTILLTCDVLAFKVVSIAGYDFAASGLLFSLSFMMASIVTEVYGYKMAGKIVWIQLICQTFFVLAINFFVCMPSSGNIKISQLYFGLYHHYYAVLIASTLAVTTAYFVNDIFLSRLKVLLYGSHFVLRILLSNAVAKAILVIISYPINFHGIYGIHKIMQIAFNTWTYKMCMAVILLPVTLFLSKKVKRLEHLDLYDYGTSYNPFKVFDNEGKGKNLYGKINNKK